MAYGLYILLSFILIGRFCHVVLQHVYTMQFQGYDISNLVGFFLKKMYISVLTLLHSERPKLCGVLAILSVVGLIDSIVMILYIGTIA